jgi:hypothetical protein
LPARGEKLGLLKHFATVRSHKRTFHNKNSQTLTVSIGFV